MLTGLLGLVDDASKVVKERSLGLTPKAKIVGQVAIATAFVLVAVNWLGIQPTVEIPFVVTLDFGILTTVVPVGDGIAIPWLYLLFMNILLVGMCNAVNLTDGIDGLCSCVTVVYMAAFACISGILGMYCETLLALLTAGGCIGFLMWNFPPAKVFMGDTGSMFLGGVVCALGVGCGAEFLMLMAALVYICEALSVVIQVTVFKITKKIYHTKEGKRLFKMTPIHHHFELSGWSELKIDVVFSLTAAVLGAGAVLLAMNMFAR